MENTKEKTKEELEQENSMLKAKIECMNNGLSEETLDHCKRVANDSNERYSIQKQILISLARSGVPIW